MVGQEGAHRLEWAALRAAWAGKAVEEKMAAEQEVEREEARGWDRLELSPVSCLEFSSRSGRECGV